MGDNYDVHFDSWAKSGRGMAEASDKLGSAVDALCHSLAGAGAPWGSDDIGRAFFNGGDGASGFGESRDMVLADLADMVNVVRATGGTLIVAGHNFKVAEDASTIGGSLPEGADKGALAKDDPYHLPEVADGLVQSDPPPAEYMQILHFLEVLVGGVQWPDGSMDGLANVRDALNTAAKAVAGVAADVGGHARTVTTNNSGDAIDSFDTFATALQGSGDEGGLLWLASALQGLAGSVDFLIKQKKAARLQFELSLAFLLLTWLIALAISWITGGSSIAAAEATTQAEGFVLRTFLQQVAKSVAAGMWFAGGMDAVGQYARIHEGVQEGFNGREMFTALAQGAIAGGVMGAAGGGVAARTNNVTKAMSNWLGASGLKGTSSRFLFAGTTGTAGNIAAQGFTEHQVDLGQAAAFGFGMAGMGTAGEGGKSLYSHFSTDHPTPGTTGSDGSAPGEHTNPTVSQDGIPNTRDYPQHSERGVGYDAQAKPGDYSWSDNPAGSTDHTSGGTSTTMAGHQDPVAGGEHNSGPRTDNMGGGQSRISDALNSSTGHAGVERPAGGEGNPTGGVYNTGAHNSSGETSAAPVETRRNPLANEPRSGSPVSRPASAEPRAASAEPRATSAEPRTPVVRPAQVETPRGGSADRATAYDHDGAPVVRDESRSPAGPAAGSRDTTPTNLTDSPVTAPQRPVADPAQRGEREPVAGQPVPRDPGVIGTPVDHGAREPASPAHHTDGPAPAHTPDAHGSHSSHNETPLTHESLEQSFQSGVKSVRDLGGGNAAEKVQLITFNDDRMVVAKTVKADRLEELHAEELTSLVGRKIDAPVPRVVARGERTVYMDYMDGTPAREVHRDYENQPDLPYWNSPEGQRLGLLDLLVGNGDRRGYNWLIGDDGKVMGVDHADAFDKMGVNPADNPFVHKFAEPHGLGGYRVKDDHPLSHAEIESIRDSIAELRPEFERRGRGDWYADVMRRLDELDAHAADRPQARTDTPGAHGEPEAQGRPDPGRPSSRIDELLNTRQEPHPAAPVPHDTDAPAHTEPVPRTEGRGPLADSVASGVRHEEPLVQGRSTDELARVTFNDGTTAVRKQFRYPLEADAETLASRVGKALGVRAPHVHQDGLTVYMDEVGGRSSYTVVSNETLPEWANSAEGRVLGLFDVLIQNPDRTGSNWRVGDADEIYAIDHSDSFRGVSPSPDLNPFAAHYMSEPRAARPEISANPLTPHEIENVRQRLEGVRPEFERRNRTDWYDAMMGRLDELERNSTGREPFFAPETALHSPATGHDATPAPETSARPAAEGTPVHEPPEPVHTEPARDLLPVSDELGRRHGPDTIEAATDAVYQHSRGAWRDAYAPITTDDLVATRLFADGDHRPINQAYYSGDHTALEPYAAQTHAVDTALDGLPAYEGEVRRTVDLDPAQVSRYRQGEVVSEPGYVIASANPHGQFRGNTEFVIESRTGRAVGPAITRHTTDQEVHFRRDTPFEVTNVENLGGGRTRIHLRELGEGETPVRQSPAERDRPADPANTGGRHADLSNEERQQMRRSAPHGERPVDDAGAPGPGEPRPDRPAPSGPLERSIASGEAERRPLNNGSSGARVEQVTFNDGSRAVHSEFSTKLDADKEYLALRTGEAVHAPVPRVTRDGETGLYTEHVDGVSAAERALVNDPYLVGSDRGRLLGFLDALIGNRDRSGFNWMVTDDHRLSGGIDHRLAFGPEVIGPEHSPFAGAYVHRNAEGRPAWSYNPLHHNDIALVRPKLEALRPEFEALGHPEWHDAMMNRFEKMAIFAAGDRPLITEPGPGGSGVRPEGGAGGREAPHSPGAMPEGREHPRTTPAGEPAHEGPAEHGHDLGEAGPAGDVSPLHGLPNHQREAVERLLTDDGVRRLNDALRSEDPQVRAEAQRWAQDASDGLRAFPVADRTTVYHYASLPAERLGELVPGADVTMHGVLDARPVHTPGHGEPVEFVVHSRSGAVITGLDQVLFHPETRFRVLAEEHYSLPMQGEAPRPIHRVFLAELPADGAPLPGTTGHGIHDPLRPLDPRLQEVQALREPTDAGVAYFDPADPDFSHELRISQGIKPLDGVFTVDLHANPNHGLVGDTPVSGRDIAALLSHEPRLVEQGDGPPPIIRSAGCESGQARLAQEVANETGLVVFAPDNEVWFSTDGTAHVSAPLTFDASGRPRLVFPPEGAWRIFVPEGGGSGHVALPHEPVPARLPNATHGPGAGETRPAEAHPAGERRPSDTVGEDPRDRYERRRGTDDQPAGPHDPQHPATPQGRPEDHVPGRSDLERGLASGIDHSRTELLGHASAPSSQGPTMAKSVELVTFNDGTQAVRKEMVPGREREADAEVLGSLVGEAVGAPVPHVYRESERVVYMDVMDGSMALEEYPDTYHQVDLNHLGYHETRGARLIGLLDILIENGDRHNGNWLITEQNEVLGIDHNLAFTRDAAVDPGSDSFAWDYITGVNEVAKNKYEYEWGTNSLSARDVEVLEQRLRALEPEFNRLGRQDWYAGMMRRFAHIKQNAGGTTSILGPEETG